MASAGTVTVDFAAETARFTAELKKVQGSLKRLETDFKSIEKVAGVALRVFSGAALASFAKQAFDAADATATAAERAGIAVETFSRLQFAAGQTDIEMAALTTGVQRFQVALSKADGGSKEAIASLSRFGLEAQALRNLSIEDQLAEVAEAFKSISDPADRTRLAVDLFGRSAGPQLVPLLSQGRAGIKQLTDEADRLGITLTTSTAAGIDQADRAIKQLTGTLSAYTAKFLAGLSIAILGPPEEILRIDEKIGELQRRRDALLSGGLGRGSASSAGIAAARKEAEEINKQITELLNKQRELLNPQPIAQAPIVQIGAAVQEIDLAPIQAMKIEVDELALAYGRLDEATRAVQAERSAEALELSTNSGLVEAQRFIEEQITNDLQFQLQARAQLESQYREQRYQQDIAYALARENLERATAGNVIGALQSFAGQSKSVAIALVAIQKAQALAQVIQLGQVAIMQAAASAPPPYNLPAIAWAKALTGISIAAVLASGYGQIRSIRASGGAPIGSPVNPINTTTSQQDQDFGATSQNTVQVIVANNVGFDQRVMDQIIAGIREAADDRDVIIFGPESRQAKELVTVNG